jgi:hypothetical protein
MGWDYIVGATKQYVINDRLKTRSTVAVPESKAIAHELIDDVLYVVRELTFHPGLTERYIEVNLLDQSDGDWGYKSMSWEADPYNYDCPLQFLMLAGNPPPNTLAVQWCEKVREFHANRR